MALITCNECGKEFSENASNCPHCGNPNSNFKSMGVPVTKHKGFWSVGRLVIGIISIVLFMLITFQSCAVGVGNTIMENGETSGTSGFFTAIFMLTAGIVGICTRNARGKTGPIVTTVLYWLAALMTVGEGESYGDLPIWGALSFIFGVVFLIAAIKTKKE